MDNFVKTLVEFVNQIKDLIKKLVESFRELGAQKNSWFSGNRLTLAFSARAFSCVFFSTNCTGLKNTA